MTRDRTVGRAAPTVAVLGGLLAVCAIDALPAMATPPNIVVIVTDDQRYGTLRWMPAVDTLLVDRGTTFTRAFVPTPTCCPSRASLLTGLLAQGTGVWANSGSVNGRPIGGWRAFHRSRMERRTIATWLTRTYRTIFVGKYLNNYDDASRHHIPQGWDRWHSFFGRNGAYHGYRLNHTNGSLTSHGHRAVDYSTDVFADLAVQEMRKVPRREPLLLYFAPYGPHGPSTPAPRHAHLGGSLSGYSPPNLNERAIGDKPPWIRALHPVARSSVQVARRNAYASLRSVDEAVARIVGALKRSHRLRRSLIIFTSDNGVSWGEHRIPIQNKFLPYTAQTHVPLVVRWDGHVRAGVRTGRLAMNADVPVTAAAAAGVDLDDVDGMSLLDRTRRHGIVFSASPGRANDGNGIWFARPPYCGFRTARYLYVHYGSGYEELYNYHRDPYELRNLAVGGRLRDVRRALRAEAAAACRPEPPGY